MILRYFLFIFHSILMFCFAYDEVSEFRDVLREENTLLALFTEECCKCVDCVEFEVMLGAMSKNLEEMNLKIVKLINPELKIEYGIKTTPAIVYIRDGIPALYDGKLEPDSIYWWLSDNGEPYTKILNDESFEHLTQAATGSTTGDWLVAFYDDSCIGKTALFTHLEGVASHLKSRLNVAIVSSKDSPETIERFKIRNCPEVILFHHGKMYRTSWATSPKLRIFAERLYKELKAELVPVPRTYFDKIVEYFAHHHLLSITLVFGSFVIIVILSVLRREKPKSD